VDAYVRLHKHSLWEPENLYLALPFGDREAWLDKAGAPVRPRIDQIPGTLTDFHAVSAGVAFRGLALAMPDQHLLQIGSLDHGERLLAGDPRLEHDPGHLYAWLMTNYWETNFDADLGGFHQFRYSLLWGAGLEDPAESLRACRNAGLDLVTFRLREDAR
jgi:hypothetical protein